MLPEHLSYPRHIRTAPTQESRRLKGTDTGFGKEIVGVDHDTRIQAVRFDIPDPDTCSPDWLGEGTLTGGSGWMFSVNGVYLSSGMNTYFPADGDEIRVRFTLYYGADIGEAMLGGETWGDW